jgi:hypothetical protein
MSAFVKGHSLPALDHDDMIRITNQLPSLNDAPEGTDITRLRRITARRSPVYGMGLFALQPISAGELVMSTRGRFASLQE